MTPEKGDVLASPQQLADWLSEHGLLEDAAQLGEDDLRRARDVRHDVRALVAATTRDREVDAAVADRLTRIAAGARPGLRYDDGGPIGFVPGAQGLDGALGALLAEVAAARRDGTWALFKLCARDGCQRAFFDASQSRTGKWCNERCGDRVRAAAYRRDNW